MSIREWWDKLWRKEPTPLEWLATHETELSVGRSPGGEHSRVYDHVTKLPHYGNTLLQAAAAAQRSREHHA